MKAIADTGFLVAFTNRRDQYHSWALSVARQISGPLLTCDAVLAEVAFHLRSTPVVLAMIQTGMIRPAMTVIDEMPRLVELAAKYEDREPDLADICLIRLSELHPGYPVITTDIADFRTYRRGRREVIPLICPPGR